MPEPKRVVLSACLIVKNEEERLPRILADLQACAGEIIVVDTGSTDRTMQLAAKAGARVLQAPWTGDFGAARNASLEPAAGKWILWVDADDRISREDAREIKRLAAAEPADRAYVVEIINQSKTGGHSSFLQLRLFPNRREIRFQGKIHESVAAAVKALSLPILTASFKIIHTGYDTPEAMQRKVRRNLQVLEAEIVRSPETITHRFLYGNSLLVLGQETAAREQFRFIAGRPRNREQQPDVYQASLTTLAMLEKAGGQLAAARNWAQQAVENEPQDLAAWHSLAMVAMEQGDGETGLAASRRALECPVQVSSIQVDFAGLRAECYQMAARLLWSHRQWAEAARLLDQAVKEQASNPFLWDYLGQTHLMNQDRELALEIYTRASRTFPGIPAFSEKVKQLKQTAYGVPLPVRPIQAPVFFPSPAPWKEALPAGLARVGVFDPALLPSLKEHGCGALYLRLFPGHDGGPNAPLAAQIFTGSPGEEKSFFSQWPMDAMVFTAALPDMESPEFWARLRHSLAPEGLVCLVLPNPNYYAAIVHLLNQEVSPPETGAPPPFTRPGLLGRLQAEGFETLRSTAYPDSRFAGIKNARPGRLNLGICTLRLEDARENEWEDFFSPHFLVLAKKSALPAETMPAGLAGRHESAQLDEAQSLIDSQKYEEARAILLDVAAKDPACARAYNSLGLIAWYQGQIMDAHHLFLAAIKHQPDFEDAYCNLADTAHHLGLWDQFGPLMRREAAERNMKELEEFIAKFEGKQG